VVVVAMVVVVTMVVAVVEDVIQKTSDETSRESCQTEHSASPLLPGMPAPASWPRPAA